MLCDKVFNIAKIPKYDGYQPGLASMDLLKLFDKKSSGRTVKSEIYLKVNYFYKELAEELPKPIIRKFEKKKVHLPFIDNILGVGLVDMLLISICNKRFRLLLYVIDIYSNYAWVFL